MENQESTQLMTLSEAAKFLRLRVSTLRAWRLQRRNLPFVQLGRKILVRQSDCESLISAGLQQPAPEEAQKEAAR